MKQLGSFVVCMCFLAGCNGASSPGAAPAADGGNQPSTQPVGGPSSSATSTAKPTNADNPARSAPAQDATPAAPTGAKQSSAAAIPPANKLVGQWDVLNKLGNLSRIYDFRDNGTYILIAIDSAPDQKGTTTMMTTGTYKLDGTQFSKHVVSLKETTDSEPMKSAAEADTKTFAKEVNSIPEYRGTVKWKDDDDAIVTASPGFDPGIEQEIQLKRHKG